MTPSVVVADLSKAYARCIALQHVNFSVEPGSIYGLIGPNGAGKTTSVTVLAGLVSPTSGKVSILGMDVKPNCRELMAKVGFASPKYSFFDYLTGAEVLMTCGLMHGLKSHEVKRRVEDLLELLDLELAAGRYLYQYSHGMRQKLGLACAIIHAPEVLLLDEPFIGMDPTSLYRIYHTLKKMAANGRSILLTSHDLALVERLCDRVGILHQGTIKREIELVPRFGSRAAPSQQESGLESVLWDVVGTPEFKELSWV